MTAVGDDYSAAYFNPGALGDLDTSMVDAGYLIASPRFQGGLKDVDDEREFNAENKVALIGFTMNLSNLFKNDQGLGIGFDVAIDDNLKSFLYFEEARDDNGQFIRYGLSSITMVTSLGVQIIPQLHVGIGGFVLVEGKNNLVAETNLAGDTKEEEIQVAAKPAIAPIAGIYAPVHSVVTIGATYKGKGVAEFSAIDASTDALVSNSSLSKLNLLMAFKDTYVPQQISLGVSVKPIDQLLIAVDATWANWGDYDREIKDGDVVRSEGHFDTHDIYIPRLGIEYTPIDLLYIRAGYYYEDTPFSDPGIGNAVVLDNAKHVGSLGVAHDIDYIPFLTYPVTVGATYFNHYLVKRTVKADDGREFVSKGDLNGLIASITLRY